MLPTRISVRLAMVFMAIGSATAAEPEASLARITKDIFFLAGEECEGRGVETKGILKAGDYIAGQFQKAGLKPGGPDGSYFQPFTITVGSPRLGTPNTLAFTSPDGETIDVEYGESFTPLAGQGKKTAELVFAGYGITADKPKYDDFAGLDVAGKFVIILRRTPRAEDKKNPFDPDPASVYAALTTKIQNAVNRKAAGVIFVNDATYGKNNDSFVDFRTLARSNEGISILQIKRTVLEKLLGSVGKNLQEIETAIDETTKPQSLALPGWKASAETTIVRTTLPCRNVIGVLEGSGPLAHETVVVGAHYDHLGNGEPGSMLGSAGKGQTHYGADDNASGTTGLLEMARRFGAMKEQYQGRRIVFIAFSAEERGLFGSIHYVNNPTFPLKDTVFMLNMDMIGRVVAVADEANAKGDAPMAAVGGPVPAAAATRDRLVVYGTGTAPEMEKIVDVFNARVNFHLLKVPTGNGPSDHESFFMKKIPVLFFFTGTHRDYHRPSDTPDKINIPGLKKVVDFGEKIVDHFAHVASRPAFAATSGGWYDPTEAKPRPSRARPAARLGVMPGNYEAESGGVLVEDTVPGGAAEAAGMKKNDRIIAIAGKPIKNIDSYMTVMATQKAGTSVEVEVIRNDKKMTFKVTPK